MSGLPATGSTSGCARQRKNSGSTRSSTRPGPGFLTGTIDQRTAFAGPDKGATPAQIALAWLLALKPWIAPIPGTRRLERLEENIGAAQVDLTARDLTEIETAAARIQVHGARYPAHLERMTGL